MFVPTGAFLYDVAGFSLKWLRDVAAEQLDDGADHQLRAGPAAATGGEYGAMAADAGVVRLG